MNANSFFGISRIGIYAAAAFALGGCHRPGPTGLTEGQQNQQPPDETPHPPAPATGSAAPAILPGSPDVATLAARVTPAVVNVTVVQAAKRGEFPFDLGPFLGRNKNGHEDEHPFRQRGLGSGFIIDSDGHVVTNAHVVEDAASVRVKLADEREFDAKVKGKDDRLDVAVLELQGAKDLPFVSLGSSDELRVGEYVVAVGNPFGLGNTVTMGIVSAKSRAIGAGPYDDFIQTDASINPGNSGGPLFNLNGQVVGINTAISAQGRGIGFAIPVDEFKEVIPQLLSTGHVARGRLGVLIQPIDIPLAKALGLDRPKGALVGEVEPGGPADRSGIRAGDVILAVNQAEIAHAQELPRMVARHQPSSRVTLSVMRDKNIRNIDVTLDALKEDATPPTKAPPSSTDKSNFGMDLGDVRGGGGAVVEHVVPGSKADDELEPGDVILEVNHMPCARAADATRLLKTTPPGQPAFLKVRRDGKVRFVAVER